MVLCNINHLCTLNKVLGFITKALSEDLGWWARWLRPADLRCNQYISHIRDTHRYIHRGCLFVAHHTVLRKVLRMGHPMEYPLSDRLLSQVYLLDLLA